MLPPSAPSCTDQLTAVDWPGSVPVTTAVNAIVPPGDVCATAGEMATAIAGRVTVTVALPDLVGSAALVAMTWNVPAIKGALYLPVASTLPPPLSWTDQVTRVSLVFETVAVKVCV